MMAIEHDATTARAMLGHDHAWTIWDDALGSARMHHAWLLTGPRGLGKASFALAAARRLVSEPGITQRQAHHPDIHILSRLPATADEEKKRDEGKPYQRKRNIAVDQIRAMQQRLVTRPTLGARRAIIIDAADDLEKAAANALLKSLEEPPQGSFFLLVAHNPGRLLPTIRSRCRALRFPPLANTEIEGILLKHAPQSSPDDRAAALAASGGSPCVALAFLAHDLGRMHGIMQAIIGRGDADLALRGSLAEAIGTRPDRERILAVIDLARAVTAQDLRNASHQTLPVLIAVHDELNRLGAQAPVYNFDPGLLVMEIGTLLASVAGLRERSDG